MNLLLLAPYNSGKRRLKAGDFFLTGFCDTGILTGSPCSSVPCTLRWSVQNRCLSYALHRRVFSSSVPSDIHPVGSFIIIKVGFWYVTGTLLSGEILPQRKLLRTITLWNISSDVGLIKYIFDVASFEEDLANRIWNGMKAWIQHIMFLRNDK